MWLTSTDDLPALKSFDERSLRLRQRATQIGNQVVVTQQGRIITNLAVRINSLEAQSEGKTLNIEELLRQLRVDLEEAIGAWEETREAGLLLAAKQLERMVADFKARIAALEEPI
jgi:hypothetical protein